MRKNGTIRGLNTGKLIMKNKSFKKKYTIVCTGITTNNNLTDFLDHVFANLVVGLNEQYKQLEVTIKEEK